MIISCICIKFVPVINILLPSAECTFSAYALSWKCFSFRMSVMVSFLSRGHWRDPPAVSSLGWVGVRTGCPPATLQAGCDDYLFCSPLKRARSLGACVSHRLAARWHPVSLSKPPCGLCRAACGPEGFHMAQALLAPIPLAHCYPLC